MCREHVKSVDKWIFVQQIRKENKMLIFGRVKKVTAASDLIIRETYFAWLVIHSRTHSLTCDTFAHTLTHILCLIAWMW